VQSGRSLKIVLGVLAWAMRAFACMNPILELISILATLLCSHVQADRLMAPQQQKSASLSQQKKHFSVCCPLSSFRVDLSLKMFHESLVDMTRPVIRISEFADDRKSPIWRSLPPPSSLTLLLLPKDEIRNFGGNIQHHNIGRSILYCRLWGLQAI